MSTFRDDHQFAADTSRLQLFKKQLTLAMWNERIFVAVENQERRITFFDIRNRVGRGNFLLVFLDGTSNQR